MEDPKNPRLEALVFQDDADYWAGVARRNLFESQVQEDYANPERAALLRDQAIAAQGYASGMYREARRLLGNLNYPMTIM